MNRKRTGVRRATRSGWTFIEEVLMDSVLARPVPVSPEGPRNVGEAAYSINTRVLRTESDGGVDFVIIREIGPRLPTCEELRRVFGLTRQECTVVLLLADRCTTAEIAEELVISRNTARHHVENVLLKLTVKRNGVRALLLDLASRNAISPGDPLTLRHTIPA